MKFSIITPSFRQLGWLSLAAASVRDQLGPTATDLSVEHIIQDAGSPGIEDFARQNGASFWHEGREIFSRTNTQKSGHYLLTIFSEPDQGMYDAINRGLRRASGDVCAWLNCDEQYFPDAFRTVQAEFAKHPSAEMICGQAVVVNPQGGYLCSRTPLAPGRLHTLLSGNLSFLSAAAFFKREIVGAGSEIPAGWRVAGDAAWSLELIKRKTRFHMLPRYLAAFVDTGENLSLHPQAASEALRLAQQAPLWARWLRPMIILTHRLRKWRSGAYRLRPFDYRIFTLQSPRTRKHFSAPSPQQTWPGRI